MENLSANDSTIIDTRRGYMKRVFYSTDMKDSVIYPKARSEPSDKLWERCLKRTYGHGKIGLLTCS